METCKRSNTDPFMALLEIGNTPTQGAGRSPSQRLINWRIIMLLPMTHNHLRPRGELEHECDKLKVKHNHTMQATYYNTRAKDLPVLKEGDRVRLKPFRLVHKGWHKGTVVVWLDEMSLRHWDTRWNVQTKPCSHSQGYRARRRCTNCKKVRGSSTRTCRDGASTDVKRWQSSEWRRRRTQIGSTEQPSKIPGWICSHEEMTCHVLRTRTSL